jgi:hypothetical protein
MNNDKLDLTVTSEKINKMSPETRAKLSASMKQFYIDNPDRKPGRLPDGTKPKRKRRAKRRNPNVTEVPLDAIQDRPEPKKRKTYTKREKKIVVDDTLKLEIVKLLNKLL